MSNRKYRTAAHATLNHAIRQAINIMFAKERTWEAITRQYRAAPKESQDFYKRCQDIALAEWREAQDFLAKLEALN